MSTDNDAVLASLGRASRRSAILGFLGFLLIVVATVFSARRLSSLETQIDEREAELVAKQAEIDALQSDVDSMRTVASNAEWALEETLAAVDRSAKAAHLVRRGINYYQRGEYENAVATYDEALLIDPRNEVIHNYRGYSLYRLGEYEEAVESLRRSVRLNPRYPEGYYNLALALWRNGEQVAALEAVRHALDIDPALKDRFRGDGQFAPFRASPEYQRLIS